MSAATVSFGITLPPAADYGDPHALVDIARDAEDAGWDGMFLWDHIQLFARPVPVLDPWIALAAVAMATERIRIGPMVTPLPRRRPAKVAREAVTLDHLANGRLILGVGIGAPSDLDFGNFGDEADEQIRGDMLDEALEVITALWSGERVAHAGEHYSVKKATFLPTPVQYPRIPVWIAGFWPNRRPFRRAARWDGVFPIAIGDGPDDYVETTPEILADIIAYVAEHREGTLDGFDVVVGGVTPREPAAAADRIGSLVEAGLTWWLENVGFGDRTYEGWRDRIRSGPPQL